VSEPALDYKTLVQDDRIHASLYTDPRIFADEMERIFHRGWVFVGHESEIPQPGDFVTRHLGAEPVIMVRGNDGGISVLINRCRHRGTMVCPADRGSARTFTCPYTGILSVPVEKVYPIEEIKAAVAHAQQGERIGKVLVTPNGPIAG
jgi:hypothetical protein